MKITYAGHSAVFIESAGFVVAIDPWLQGNPRCPAELENPEKLDLILLSHGHADHAGDVVRLMGQTTATLACGFELGELLMGEGVDESRIELMNPGGTVQIGPARVSLTPAVHSSSYDSPTRGTIYAGLAQGIVLKIDNRTVYHAGDTALFMDMALIREHYQPELAFLPIGDRFTMGGTEAAEAAKILGVKSAVPIHYKTFGALAQTADEFRGGCTHFGIAVHELEPGEVLDF